jgi:hypothetical protein
MRSVRSIPVVLAALAALTACDGDATGPRGDLSRGEAMSILPSVLGAAEAAGSASVKTTPNSSAVDGYGPPFTFTHSVETSHPCPLGGVVRLDFELAGSYDGDTKAASLDLDGVQTHDGCAITHEGVTLTVTGRPNLAFAAAAAAVNGQANTPFTFDVDGAVNWTTSDGRSGTCEITIDAATDFQAKRRTVQASVCGHTVTETTTWS